MHFWRNYTFHPKLQHNTSVATHTFIKWWLAMVLAMARSRVQFPGNAWTNKNKERIQNSNKKCVYENALAMIFCLKFTTITVCKVAYSWNTYKIKNVSTNSSIVFISYYKCIFFSNVPVKILRNGIHELITIKKVKNTKYTYSWT